MPYPLQPMNPQAYIGFLETMVVNHKLSPSQLLQDIFCLYFNEFKKGGFFVEFGATDGFDLSNTYMLEKRFGWTGILAEPLPSWHGALRKRRKCIIDKRCVYSSSGQTLKFLNTYIHPELSGLAQTIPNDLNSASRAESQTIEVQTVSLSDLLAEHKAPERIDYLSIDTEGSELEILSGFDFGNYRIETLTVEHNFVEAQRNGLKDLLEKNGFVRVFEAISRWDDWYVQKDNPVLAKLLAG